MGDKNMGMTREEEAIKALKWFKAYNEEDYCGGDRIQDEHGDWYYRITEQDFEAFDTAIKALEQEPKIVSIAEIKFDENKLKELVNKAVLTVTPQPRKGHWIDEGVYADGQGYHSFMCSECEWHLIEYKNMLIDYKHCPFCGAPMREVEE